MNKTALVTGASDGIGFEFCRHLARRGYDLVLVARNEKKLKQAALSLSEQEKITCTAISCDLSKPQSAQDLFQQVKEKGLHINFLINNAGLLYNGFFTELDLADQENMMMLNMVSLTALSHLFAVDMTARKGGHILNLSSLAAWMPIPNQNVYAASKAYVLSFTQALADEMQAAGSGVVVTALCPGYTATKMLDNPKQGASLKIAANMILPAEFVAEQGINACLNGRETIIPGLANRIFAYITRLFPKMTMARLMGKSYRKNTVS